MGHPTSEDWSTGKSCVVYLFSPDDAGGASVLLFFFARE